MINLTEFKTSTVFNLAFAILSCFFFFFWIIDLCFLIPAVAIQICTVVAEFEIPTEIPTKEVKAEIKTHPVIVEAKIK